MSFQEDSRSMCPECEPFDAAEFTVPTRRGFLKTVGGTAAVVVAANGSLIAAPNENRKRKPAEDLIRELYSTLSDAQKTSVVLPWNHGAGKKGNTPTRLRMYNRPLNGERLADKYTKPQQELIHRILKSICADEEGYRRISKDGTWDATSEFEGCGSHLFGNPGKDGEKFAWLFTAHHLTVRCDGNSLPGAAFGGPMYYGHLPNGYDEDNVFNFQTKKVAEVFDALSEDQRKAAIADGTPGERAASIRFQKDESKHPGIGFDTLSDDQRKLVQSTMRDILSMFRQDDVDEVMQIVKANGGLNKIHLAFYEDKNMRDGQRWHFWRLEGPGFVWNYRVLPHVHCYVNIAKQA